ncbi:bifunctional phosphoglucose/phosphomannose isomerase [Chloroflexota bacterium]
MPQNHNIDDPTIYARIDTSGMREHLHAFPGECLRAWNKISSFDLSSRYKDIDKVMVLGMGGSAIGGDMAQSLSLLESKAIVSVLRDYHLPPFVDNRTLVVASSYSGNTEETLTAFNEALKTPAKKLAMTTGGRLEEVAGRENIPIFTVDYKSAPRAAFPHSFVPLMGILQKTGVLKDKSGDLTEAVQVMNKLASEIIETVPTQSNPAKKLAEKIFNRIAVVYGAWALTPVAGRWKAQMNENAKTMAFAEVLPELNHNAIVGYELPPAIRESVFVILLSSPSMNPRLKLRYEATTQVLKGAGISHEIVQARGESPLSQMLSTVLFGDYVSYYLSIMSGIDPTPVKVIDFLKNYLTQHQ